MPVITAGGGVSTASLTLTHAQTLTLPTNTTHVIVPAPGAGKMVVPIWAVFACDSTAGAYTNFNNTATINANPFASSVYLAWDAPTNFNDATGPAIAGVSDAPGAGLLAGGTLMVVPLNGVSGNLLVAGASGGPDSTQPGIAANGYANVPLYVVGQNNTFGNFTGGNAANTLVVTVGYVVVPV